LAVGELKFANLTIKNSGTSSQENGLFLFNINEIRHGLAHKVNSSVRIVGAQLAKPASYKGYPRKGLEDFESLNRKRVPQLSQPMEPEAKRSLMENFPKTLGNFGNLTFNPYIWMDSMHGK